MELPVISDKKLENVTQFTQVFAIQRFKRGAERKAAALPARPQHLSFPLPLLPSGPDGVHGKNSVGRPARPPAAIIPDCPHQGQAGCVLFGDRVHWMLFGSTFLPSAQVL